MRLVLLLAPFTALAIFALMLGFQLARAPDGEPASLLILILVALFLTLVVAVIQVAAFGVVRLLPWGGPSLKVDGGDHLRRVFE